MICLVPIPDFFGSPFGSWSTSERKTEHPPMGRCRTRFLQKKGCSRLTTMKKLVLGLWGIVHGTIGTMWAIAGFILAFPLDSSPGTKEWAEDCQFIPMGYGMLAIWAIATFISYYLLRKNKTGIVIFSTAWLAGIMICISLIYLRIQYMLA